MDVDEDDVLAQGDETPGPADAGVESEDGSDPEFDSCYCLTISGTELVCYHSSTRQCEFVTSTVASFFLRTNQPQKALERFKENLELIVETHRNLVATIHHSRKEVGIEFQTSIYSIHTVCTNI